MWPIRFVEGSQLGKRKKDDVGRENMSEREKRAQCEQGAEVESDFEYEQNEEVNGILIQKLNKEIELEIERERLLDVISFSV
jgi:hypothetical protein